MNKMKYQKPEITYVDFALTSSVASDCKLTAQHAEGICSPVIVDASGWTVYNSSHDCDYEVDYDGICYHVPVADANIFTS